MTHTFEHTYILQDRRGESIPLPPYSLARWMRICTVLPHMHCGRTRTNKLACAAIDMWALGVVAYIMMCGFNPFDPTAISSDAEILSNIVAGLVSVSRHMPACCLRVVLYDRVA